MLTLPAQSKSSSIYKVAITLHLPGHNPIARSEVPSTDIPASHSLNTSSTMSAPNAGRQSPEPETQSGDQIGNIADHKHNTGAGEKTAQKSQNKLDSLESNPKGVMEDAAKAKTEKTQ